MQRMGRIKDITDMSHHRVFSQIFRSIERRITARPGWTNRSNTNDLSGIVFNPEHRLMMNPGETFAFSINWGSTSKGNPAQRPVIAQGTPYGVVALSYPVELKTGVPFSPFSNIDQCVVVASDNFWAAANRFAVLNPLMMGEIEGWKIKDGYRGKVLEKFVKFWLLTTHFHEQIQQQAELDKSTSFEVGDGIPLLKPESKDPKQDHPKRSQANMKSNHNRRRQSARNAIENAQTQEA